MIFSFILSGIIFILGIVSRLVFRVKFSWDDFFNLLPAVKHPPRIQFAILITVYLAWRLGIYGVLLGRRPIGPRQ
jgi:hypothetical protein